MLENIKERLAGKRTVILGVGNILRGDDGIGSELADRLQGRLNATVIDAGEVPENFIGPIIAANPEVLVIVDAAQFGASPGNVAIIETGSIANAGLSTHSASLNLFLMVLRSEISPDVFILGVQPATTAFGSPMSPTALGALILLEDLLRRSLPED